MKTYKTLYLAAAAVMLAGAADAGAIVPFNFSGMGVSGHGTFTVVPNVSSPDPNPLCGTAGQNPCRADPAGAWRITAVHGTFTDANIGLFNIAISGLIPINPENEHDPVFDPLVPTSLSFVPAGLSYNNLFFPNGNPIDCNYPFFGTFVDVFGTAFTLANGLTVDFWGDGNAGPGGALTYGAAVATDTAVLDYQFAGITAGIPEPLTLSLFGAGLVGAAALRRKRSKTA